MSDLISAFVEEARAVSLDVVADLFGRAAMRGSEWTGPCPLAGGKDAYAVNVIKGVWNCRKCGTGGHDAISLVAHECGFDLSSRSGFLGACAEVLGRPVPDPDQRESDEERQAREARAERMRAEAQAKAQDAEERKQYFRDRAIVRARNIYLNDRHIVAPGAALMVRDYLRFRTGFTMPEAVFESIRYDRHHTYWHGRDERGYLRAIHTGAAMLAPIVDLTGKVFGCHETWIDLKVEPKRRPLLIDDKGERLPTKKMQGQHKGMLIPVLGDLGSSRWVIAEGIENVAAVAGLEGFRADTFYCAAGSLGNLAGPAASKERHPTLVNIDKRGARRPAMVPGPIPKPDQDASDALQVPGHVDVLVLIGDGDSEKIMTTCAMERAELRLSAPGRTVTTEWAPKSAGDFSEYCMGMADG
ncbi:P4 alpha zinc-binding domain-containing protein [Martelella alba]|uniref:P4 alpha zinc-binding domain-containing protein n=1 Tax=Martelella alba TaxID=2590451 RepID=A0A506U9U4_9HYPH|nr:P4 alpha zinc-binding domain-containing protein [Martelella alba]TPW28597.1 P4 alpha zinc-binding domain-containing protein [Martelella alba]